ncbi:MAG: GlxA family transcriptional regulator [Gammaproteobacteria bacterium]
MRPLCVAVIAFDGVIPFHLSVPCLVFGEGADGVHPFEVVVCAGEPGVLRTSAGFTLEGLASLEEAARADVIVLPGWRDLEMPPPPQLGDALVAAQARGAQVIGLCYASFALAHLGLLDGRRATTHWEGAGRLAERFPAVEVDVNALYIEDGNVLTSAGTVASIDACLHLMRERLGAVATNRVARRLVVTPHRDGGQAQFIEQPLPRGAGDHRLAHLIAAVRERLDESHSVDSLAAAACMSRRSFTRHFKALTGTTVHAWLLSERLALAQAFLESTDWPVERIAAAAGFGGVAALRERFRAVYGIAPSAWRGRFRARATEPV